MSRDQRRLRHWPISNEYSNFAKAKPERVSDDVTRKIGPLDFMNNFNCSSLLDSFPHKILWCHLCTAPKMNFCMKSNHLSHWSLLSIQSQWFKITYEDFSLKSEISTVLGDLRISCAIKITFFSSKTRENKGSGNKNFNPIVQDPAVDTPSHCHNLQLQSLGKFWVWPG